MRREKSRQKIEKIPTEKDKELITKVTTWISALTFCALFWLKILGIIKLNWILIITSFVWVPIGLGLVITILYFLFLGLLFFLMILTDKKGRQIK